MIQIDPSHISVGAASGVAVLALSETVRYFIRRSRNGKEHFQCRADSAVNAIDRHQAENKELLMDIRDGVNKLCTLTEKQ